MSRYNVTVYIIDNPDDAADDRQVVSFKLSAGNTNNDFPAEWQAEAGFDIGTLTVRDDAPAPA